jgi:hypothetical protein
MLTFVHLYLEALLVIVFNDIVKFSAGLFHTKKVLVFSRRGHLSYLDGLYFVLNSNLRWFRHQSVILWDNCHTLSSSPRQIKREANKQFYGATCRGQACGDGPINKNKKASRNRAQNEDRNSCGKFCKTVKNVNDIPAGDLVITTPGSQINHIGIHIGNEKNAIDVDDDDDDDETHNDDFETYVPLNDSDFNLNFVDDLVDLGEADLAMKVEVAKWRTTHTNTNIRGAGSSKSTYYAHKADQELLAQSAAINSQPISRYFPSKAASLSDEDYIANCLKDPVGSIPALVPKYTVTEALDKLSTGDAAITKNLNKNKKLMKQVIHWNYIVALSIHRFLELTRFITV